MSSDPLAQALIRMSFLRRRWRAIALWTLVAACAGALYAWRAPARYSSTAGVAILHTRLTTTLQVSAPDGTDEDLAAAIMSSPQSALQGSPQLAASYLASRRQTLVAMVANESVAEAVLARLAGSARPDERAPGELVSRVEGALADAKEGDKDRTDLIEVTVHGGDPARAAHLANLWAVEYVKLVNQRLGPCADLPALRQRLEEARRARDEAESAYIAFLDEGAGPGQVVQTAAQVERAECRRHRMIQARDRARTVCEEVETRMARLPHEAETAAEEVRLVAKAAVPKSQLPPTPVQTVGLAALVGLLVGMAWAYARELVSPYRGGPPGAAEAPSAPVACASAKA
ncbi:MAG: hypothetical protein AAB434_07325 [Planctomycetota bacterium]